MLGRHAELIVDRPYYLKWIPLFPEQPEFVHFRVCAAHSKRLYPQQLAEITRSFSQHKVTLEHLIQMLFMQILSLRKPFLQVLNEHGLSPVFFFQWIVLALTALLSCLPVAGQPLRHGAVHGALANATTGLPVVSWFTPNPAAAGWEQAGLLSFHVVQAYGLPELRYAQSQLVVPAGRTALLAGIRHLGVATYSDLQVDSGVAFPVSLGSARSLTLGVLASWRQVRVQTYGTGHAWGISLGMQVALLSRLYLGAAGRHLFQIGATTLSLDRSLSIGLAYQPFSALWLVGAVVQEVFYEATPRFGIAYSPLRQLQLRYGLSLEPRTMSMGIGIALARLSFDLAAARHVVLGWTPGLSINLTLLRRKAP